MKGKVYFIFQLVIVILSIDMVIALTLRQRCKLLRWESAINVNKAEYLVIYNLSAMGVLKCADMGR